MSDPTPTASAESAHESAALAGSPLAALLLGEDEFAEPVHLLRDLAAEQATAMPAAQAESIAAIVGHMQYWQHRALRIVKGESPERPTGSDDWPSVGAERWMPLVAEFLADLDDLTAAAESGADLNRTLDDGSTAADRVRRTALHNAYHLGQIALLRRQLGFWPPEGGENTY